MATATETQENPSETTFEYAATVEDAGPASKRVTIEIPQERIQAKLAEQLKEVRQNAAIPGFRVGKTPVKLIEKRFGSDIRDQVRVDLIRESLTQVVEKNDLNILGEPDFDKDQELNLPESGSLKYTFNVEIRPKFTLPDFAKVTVRKPKISINDEHVQQALTNLRNQQGQLVPVEDRGVEAGDYLNASVTVTKGDDIVAEQNEADIVVRDGVIASILIKDLATHLAGAKMDETKTFDVVAQADHPVSDLAGQTVKVAVKINVIKRLELAEVDQDFLDQFGFENEAELLAELRTQMEQRVTADVRGAMHNQLRKLLLDNVTMELPPKMLERQKQTVASRNVREMIYNGSLKMEQVEAVRGRLIEAASVQAQNELKLFFVFTKLAEEKEIEISDYDINSAVATAAMQEGKRPEKLKSELAQNGGLDNLAMALRDGKVLDSVLEVAKVEEVDNTEGKVLEASVD